MNFGILTGLILVVAIISTVVTYLLTRLRMERMSAQRAQALAEAVAALENEKAKFDEAAKGIANLSLLVDDHRVAVRRLVAGRSQRVQRQRIDVRRRSLLLDHAAQNPNLDRVGVHGRKG